MKKILILLFLFSTQFISAQLEVLPKVAFDYAPARGRFSYTFLRYDGYDMQVFGNYRGRSAIELNYNNFSVEFDTHIYMNKGISYMFAPTRADFFVNLRYHFTDKIMINVEHLCMHPIVSIYQPMREFNGGHTKIGISYGY